MNEPGFSEAQVVAMLAAGDFPTMSARRSWIWITTAALTVLWGNWGCSTANGPSSDLAKVKGTVKLKGKMLKGGFVQYSAKIPPNSRLAPRQSPITKEGQYGVITPSGVNYVTVIPPKAGKPLGQELEVEVKAGTNTKDLEFQ